MSKVAKSIVISIMLSVFIFGCSQRQDYSDSSSVGIKKDVEQMLLHNKKIEKVPSVPIEFEDELIKEKSEGPNQKEQSYYNISTNAMPAKKFFVTLARKTGVNMVVDQNITGNITFDLNQLTLKEILKVLSDVYGFYFRYEGNIIYVSPSILETKIFNLEGLALKRSGSSSMQIDNSSQLSGTSRVARNTATSSEVKTLFDLENVWDDIKLTIKSIIQTGISYGEDGDNNIGRPEVSVNQATGTIVVRAYPKEMHNVEKLIKRLHNMYNKQVVIETKLLEVQLKKQYETGLDLQLPRFQFTSTIDGLKFFKEDVTYENAAGVDKPFRAFIHYLSSQGKVTVLSSPRIVTMNRQKAVIKVGSDSYYMVGQDAISSTYNSSVATKLSLQPFFSGIALDVTPEIQENDNVILHIHPLISEVVGKDYSFQLGGTTNSESYSLKLPESTVRESDSIIRAKSGQFIAVGGLIKRKTETNKKQLPKTFGVKNDYSVNDYTNTTELVIVLWPKIVDNSAEPTFSSFREEKEYKKVPEKEDLDKLDQALFNSYEK